MSHPDCGRAADCSAECQRWDWKKGGHKAACADIQSQLRADGAAVAAQLGDSFLPMGARLDDLHRVDVSFAYRAALEAGLHASLLTFLRDDAAGVTARFRSGEACSGVGLALNVLFRGQRRSRGAGTRYTRADGGRAAAFIESHPDAWPAWLGAVKALVETMADRELKRMGQGMAAQPPARDALASLLLVLAREEVARALCFVPPGGARSARPELASARMAHTAGACRRMLESARKASALGADPGSNIEGYLNQVIAQLDLWTKRFEIPDVDVLGMQRFSSAERAAYRAMAEPLARVFVEYGCMPPAHVSNAALGR